MTLQIFTLLASFLLPGLFSSAVFSANRTTLDTIFTCSQNEGEVGYEVGIILNDGPGVRALIVAHDNEKGTMHLLANLAVTPFPNQGIIVYEDQWHTFKLQLESMMGQVFGQLSLLQDGPNSLLLKNLRCQNQSQITYDLAERVKW